MNLPNFMENKAFDEIIESMNISDDDFVENNFKISDKYKIGNFENKYSRDWKKVSQKYKKYKNYKCEVCGLDCHITKYYLHVTHINGNKFNNSYRNLRCVCRSCFSNGN